MSVTTETELPDYEFEPPPAHAPQVSSDSGWSPRLNPTQQKIFDCIAKYILAYGEKGSGKTIGCLHALVRHCYWEKDALALVIAPAIRTGQDGVFKDLEWILDIWKNGNVDIDDPDVRTDSGLAGFEYTDSKLDPKTKDRMIYIGNRHGGWSRVLLISIPYAEVVAKRMKALSPSFVYADEMTELESIVYFTNVALQIGRRRGIEGPQQYYASTNPEGPSHWVWKVFFANCLDKTTGLRKKTYEVFHVKRMENKKNVKGDYFSEIEDVITDPTEYRRLILGEWIDRPAGDAIFKNFWRPEFHVRGDPVSGPELTPKRGYPIVVSLDPGPANYSVHFMQFIPTKDGKVIWLVFDELNFVGEYKPDFVVVPRILERVDFWTAFLGGQPTFLYIADEAAFNQRRQDGSYDATRLRELSKGRIIPRACPKGKESVPARVQMTISMLVENCMFVNARRCPKTIDMFNCLVSEKPKDGKYDSYQGFRPKRSAYIHPFDSFSYGPYYFQMNPAHFALQTSEVEAFVFKAGQG